MFRFLCDENFNGDIVRGLLLRQPNLELVRVQDLGLMGAEDPDILAWAAENDRILLTHDQTTMPRFAYSRVASGEAMPGVLVFKEKLSVGHVIQELILIMECSESTEWNNRVVRFPL